MAELVEKLHIKKTLGTAFEGVKSAWNWTRTYLWPVYSAAIVLSMFQMLAMASEKQIMADHFYGDPDHTFEDKKDSLVQDSKKYFNEEVTLAVKEKVWQMPPYAFKREYADRHGA